MSKTPSIKAILVTASDAETFEQFSSCTKLFVDYNYMWDDIQMTLLRFYSCHELYSEFTVAVNWIDCYHRNIAPERSYAKAKMHFNAYYDQLQAHKCTQQASREANLNLDV